MFYTLGTAAKATGKSKPTIMRAIRDGKISCIEKTSDGYKIDPSELHRVFPPVKNEPVTKKGDETGDLTSFIELKVKLEAALQRVADKEEQLEDVQKERDSWRQQATYLLDDKREKEGLLAKQQSTEQELREKITYKETQLAQTSQLLNETQAKIEKARKSWFGKLLLGI